MTFEALQALTVGKQYPNSLSGLEGAISDFLRPHANQLIVALPNMDSVEEKALKKGELRCGVLFKNNAINFIWQFSLKNKPVLTLDSPFSARATPDINLHNVENSETRLAIELHAVDSATNQLKALRVMTMPPGLTIEFMSAVQDQLSNPQSDEAQHAKWQMKQPVELVKQVKQMWRMGT